MTLIEVENLFLWLMIYSIIGWIYESIVCSVDERRLVNRGFLNGPYCPIYGTGALLGIVVLGRIENMLLLFVLGAVLCSVLEYLTSYAMEKLFHARWWDYSEHKFNIGGRVCLLGAVVFGAFIMLLVKYIHPFISSLTNAMPPLTKHIVCGVWLAIFVADIIITLIGISGLGEKLKLLSDEIGRQAKSAAASADEYKKAITQKFRESEIFKLTGAACAAAAKQINFQERRILKAFPKFKPIGYEDALAQLREWIKSLGDKK